MDVNHTTASSDSSNALVNNDIDPKAPCSVCQAIADAFPAKETISLGTWQGYLDRKECACCQLIVSCLKTCRPHELAFEPLCQLRFHRMIDSFWLDCDDRVDIHSGDDKVFDHPIIDLIPKHISGQEPSGYLPVDPTHINITRLRTWPEYCTQNHERSCHSLPHWQIIPSASSLILVDVQDYCLVHFPDQMSHRYVALSYVWGQLSDTVELRRANYNHLFLKNSLKSSEDTERIPRTILDAITLTREMGLRYLWVDRVCIIQDEPTHLTRQLQQMASIYANSYFTIIAADGTDADYGLRGVASDTSARTYKETIFQFSKNFNMIMKPRPERKQEAFWHTRAWTFQERTVSPRNLIFTQDTVYWQCRKTIWHENVIAEPDGIAPSRYGYSQEYKLLGPPCYTLNTKAWPDMEQYFRLVCGYNDRNLAFESDALHAFSAITTAMTKSFPGGFHFGLPVFLFDVAMLWVPRGFSSRRHSFPSWSWLGWTGEVHLPFGYASFWKLEFDYSGLEIEINPLIDWYATREDGSPSSLIDNSYHMHKADVTNPAFQLPNGWTKKWNFEHDADAFEHEDLPDHSFKQPFPIFPAVSEDQSHLFSQYLNFEVNSCTLLLGATQDMTALDPYDSLMVDIQDIAGSWAGVIQPMNVAGDEYKCGSPCQLVAISQGTAMRDDRTESDPVFPYTQAFDEMHRVPAVAILEKYCFYNVLLLEWIDGIAYRRATGRVIKDIWDQQIIKRVSVILG